MAIKRYIADADTTITNAYKENLSTIATGANMGASDSLEVFSIWGQMSSSANGISLEKSRALLNFPVSTITSDRAAGNIPAAGSVNFYLKLSNAVHPNTLPSNYDLVVLPVSESWEEGFGLDMETYRDAGYANWFNATSAPTAATATILVISTCGEADLVTKVFELTDSSGANQLFTFDVDGTATANGTIGIDGENVAAIARSIVDAINDASVTIGITASPDVPVAVDGDYPITLTQDTGGTDGNKTITGTSITNAITYDAAFTGGEAGTLWGGGQTVAQGGTYHSASAALYSADATTYAKNLAAIATQTFTEGDEDLEVDITTLVEQWVDETKDNYGVAIMMSGTYEGGELSASFYTKKFFARGSEYFYKRPWVEARWDSSKRDDRANFYASSALATTADETNTLYFYNWVRGQLKNIPDLYNAIATATFTFAGGRAVGGSTITLIDIYGVQRTYEFNTTATTGDQDGVDGDGHPNILVLTGDTSSTSATNLKTAVEGSTGHNGSILVTANSSAGVVLLTQAASGPNGNTAITLDWAGAATGGPFTLRTDPDPPATFTGGVDSNTLDVKLYSAIGDTESAVVSAIVYPTADAGIYTASIATTTTATTLYDVWSTGSAPLIPFHTGSAITVKSFSGMAENPNPNYVTSMVGFRSTYSTKETARLRLFIRKQNWSPTIYTKATETLDSAIIDAAYYRIFRASDNFEVIPYGTGSDNQTRLSYDQSGSYFDLNMNLFESDFAYGINFAYYLNGKYVEQPEVFKFRVEG